MKTQPLLLAATVIAGAFCASAAIAGESDRLNSVVNELRRATAPLHPLEAAAAAGWDTPITGCIANPDPAVGGMGYHYANETLLADGTVDPLRPEVLVYAPKPGGGMQLVAVEYIVFTELNPVPPELFGQTFHLNPNINAWTLHAWVWKHNPSGLFADFNPNVSCL
ncbi:hypothetical protein [Aerolutibacter ruishenii]|uniref:Uncharacterized protein n=1 Tax=Aerolutibacter ruishenii TaxID=686800 RepID=A0A562LI71_9GAMM|nr:hypothetical protein [Lysobacter ruishenii]TWI07303.1 hypothetical protein IP93_02655 [Lysobacter ruishenii]